MPARVIALFLARFACTIGSIRVESRPFRGLQDYP